MSPPGDSSEAPRLAAHVLAAFHALLHKHVPVELGQLVPAGEMAEVNGEGGGGPRGTKESCPNPPPLGTCTSRASPLPTRSAPGALGSCRLTRWLHQSRALGATRLSGLTEGSLKAARARRAGRSWQKGGTQGTTWAFSSRNNRAKVFWAEPCCLLGREDPRGCVQSLGRELLLPASTSSRRALCCVPHNGDCGEGSTAWLVGLKSFLVLKACWF